MPQDPFASAVVGSQPQPTDIYSQAVVTPQAPRPQPKPKNGLDKMRDFFGHGLTQAGSAINHGVDRAGYMGTHVPELMGAIVNVPDRIIEGGIIGAMGSHKGTNPITDTLGSSYQALVHPGAAVAMHRALRQRTGLKPFSQFSGIDTNAHQLGQAAQNQMTAVDPFAPQVPSTALEASLHGLASLATNAGMDEAQEQVGDLPAYMFKEADLAYQGLRLGGKILPMAIKAIPGVGQEGFDNLMTSFNQFHGINRDHAPVGAAEIRGEAGIHRQSVKAGQKRANDLVAKHEAVLNALPQMFHGPGSRQARRAFLARNPETKEIIDELDRVSWVEGTQQVRDTMMAHGYKPPDGLEHLPPGNTLHHWDENYFPTQAATPAESAKGPVFGQWRTSKSNNAGYNQRGGDGEATDNVVEQVRQRIANGYKNAARAQYQRRVIRVSQNTAKPGAEMTSLDLNDAKAPGAGNIFQSGADAQQQAILRDIGEGNSPAAAFTPTRGGSPLINRDIQTGGPMQLRSKLSVSEKPVQEARATLIQAQREAEQTASALSKHGLDRQQAVSEAATKAGEQAKTKAKQAYNRIADADVKVDQRVKGLEGGSREVSAEPSRDQSSGFGALPGTPRLAGVVKAEKSAAKAVAKAKASTPEHRQLIQQATDALTKARADFEAAKKEIYSRFPRKPGEAFPPEVNEQLRAARVPVDQAQAAYQQALTKIKTERQAFAASKESPELQAALAKAQENIEKERAAYKEAIKGKKLKPEEKAQERTQLDKAIGEAQKVREMIQAKRAELTSSQSAEVAKAKKLQIKRTTKAQKAGTGQGFVTPQWQAETQRVTSAAGQRVRKALDPLFASAIRDEKNAGKFVNSIHRAAIGGKVDQILKGSKAVVSRATRDLMREEGKLAAAHRVNDTVDRISTYIEEELARSGKVEIPKSVEDLLFNRATPSSLPGMSGLANVFRDATFALPWVHGYNLVQQTLANGINPAIVAKGLAYSRALSKNDPRLAEQLKKLESLGQAAEYSGHDEPAFGKLPKIGPALAEMSRKGQEALDHIDHGLKIAVMEHLEETKGLSGPLLGAELEKIYGSAEPSWVAQVLRGIGGFYSNWRVNVLPRTMHAGMMTEKGRKAVRQMNQLQNFATQESEYLPNRKDGASPTEFNLFPAVNEAQGLFFGGPYGAAKYALSSGTLGIIPELIQLQRQKGTSALSQLSQGTVPFVSNAAALVKDVYDKDPYASAADVLSIVGPRIQKESQKQLQEKLKYLPQTYEGL